MKNFIQPGQVVTQIAPAGGVTSGQVVQIGNLIGVAAAAAEAGSEFELSIEGVFEIPVASALDVSAGDLLYWDSTDGELNDDSAGNSLAAVAITDAGTGVATVHAKLIQPVT